LLSSLADLLRIANSYYSNLIEGNEAHPNRVGNDRNLQLEAKAHVEVQRWIDGGGLRGRSLTVEGVREIHRRLYQLLPEGLTWAEDPERHRRFRVMPGELRNHDLRVWGQAAVSAASVPRLLKSFEQTFGSASKAQTIVSLGVAHQRLLWIHPFPDGNARVARLMSHATMLEVLDTGSVWSVARGLAANVDRYRSLLANCATLSEDAISEFQRFFLGVCIDQVDFMTNLLRLDRLRPRILLWADQEIRLGKLPANSGSLLEALLYRGEISRGETQTVFGTGERQARRIVTAMLDRGVLTSNKPAGPVRLAFPVSLASQWLPGLIPD
jgi:Fic family protein